MTQDDIYIGLMSGTSVDAIDAVAVRFMEADTKPELEIISTLSFDIPDQLKNAIIKLNHPSQNEIDLMMRTDIQLGQVFAEAALSLLDKSGLKPEQIKAIGSHGQTIRHQVEQDPRYTLQIANPNVIAQKTGITTVADFRMKDIIEGGQGAPLVPAFHEHLFKSGKNRIVLNVGGMANVSFLLPEKETSGFDTGPGNVLMDAWIKKYNNKAYDENGRWAESGNSNKSLLDDFLSEPYFQQAPPKSTGRELFDLHWLNEHLNKEGAEQEKPENIQASLLELSCESIAAAIETWGPESGEIYVCGGGASNAFLMKSLRERLNNYSLASTSEIGLDPEWVEACAFAWLGKRCLENKFGNLPSVTGASKPVILGGIYSV